MTEVVNLRGKPWLTDESDVVRVDRQTKWGNPYRIGRHGSRDGVLVRYARWLREQIDNDHITVADIRRELRGKRLACWCTPKPCHAQILAEVADFGLDMLTAWEKRHTVPRKGPV